jgi:BASS family bile acid:Na+ symporter
MMGEAVTNSLPLNIVTLCIPVLFLFLGLNSNLQQFKILFKEKISLIFGFVIQFLLLPFIGLLISRIFSDSLFAYAAVIVLIVPGGHISGLLTHIKDGNVPLSVFLTSTTSLLSPLTIIFWLSLLSSTSSEYNIDALDSFIQLMLFIFSPFIFGMLIKNKYQRISEFIYEPLDKFLKVLIVVLSIWTPIDLSSYVLDNLQQGLILAFTSLISIFFLTRLFLSYFKIGSDNSKTLQIEALCQNFPIVLGISLSLKLPEIAVYGIIYYLTSTVFAVSYSFIKKY